MMENDENDRIRLQLLIIGQYHQHYKPDFYPTFFSSHAHTFHVAVALFSATQLAPISMFSPSKRITRSVFSSNDGALRMHFMWLKKKKFRSFSFRFSDTHTKTLGIFQYYDSIHFPRSVFCTSFFTNKLNKNLLIFDLPVFVSRTNQKSRIKYGRSLFGTLIAIDRNGSCEQCAAIFKVTTIIPATFSLCPISVVRGSSNCSVSWKIFTTHVSTLKKKRLLFMFYSVLFKTKWYWEEHRTFVLGNRKMFLSQQKKEKLNEKIKREAVEQSEKWSKQTSIATKIIVSVDGTWCAQ